MLNRSKIQQRLLKEDSTDLCEFSVPDVKPRKGVSKRDSMQGSNNQGIIQGTAKLDNVTVSSDGKNITIGFTTSLQTLNFTFEEFKFLFSNLGSPYKVKAESIEVGTVVAKPSNRASQVAEAPVATSVSSNFDFSGLEESHHQGTAEPKPEWVPTPAYKSFSDYSTASYNNKSGVGFILSKVSLDSTVDIKKFKLSNSEVAAFNYNPTYKGKEDIKQDFYGSFALKHIKQKYGLGDAFQPYEGLDISTSQEVSVVKSNPDELKVIAQANPKATPLELTLMYYRRYSRVPAEDYMKHLRHLRDYALASKYPVIMCGKGNIGGVRKSELAGLNIKDEDFQRNRSKVLPRVTEQSIRGFLDESNCLFLITAEEFSKISQNVNPHTLQQYLALYGVKEVPKEESLFTKALHMEKWGASREYISNKLRLRTEAIRTINGKFSDVAKHTFSHQYRIFEISRKVSSNSEFIKQIRHLADLETLAPALKDLEDLGMLGGAGWTYISPFKQGTAK